MLVELLRTRSQLNFDRLLALTRQLGYTPEKPTVPDAMRRMVFIGAFSIMTDDSRAILEHLFKLHSIHPDVKRFWISARFSLVATPAAREASRIFLETKCLPLSKLNHGHIPFLLTLRQLRAVLKTSAAQMAKIKKLTPLAQKSIYSCFTVDEADTLARKANEFLLTDDGRLPIPKKEMLCRAEVCQKLNISLAALKIYVQHNLLKPCLGCKHTPFFFRSDIEQFSMHFEPLQNLSKKLGKTVRSLYSILELLDIKITPNRNLKDRYWLINKTDIECIIKANRKKNKKPRDFIALPPIDFRNKPPADYMTTREAAKALEMEVENVGSAIRAHILKGACRGRHMRIYIPKIEVKKFKIKYFTTVQAASFIKVHYPRAPDLLFGLGVSAVIGPTVDGARENIYKATDILRIAKLGEAENPNEHFNYYSKTFAAKRLLISPDMLSMLMNAKLIKYIKGRTGFYFRPSWLNSFAERFIVPSELSKLAHMSIKMFPQITDALENIGIMPIKLRANARSFYLYNRATLSDSHDEFSKKMKTLNKSRKYRTYLKHTTRTPPKGYTPIKDLLNTYDISSHDFSNLFIKFGLINTITNNQTRYISADDRIKCESILEQYCTCTMASKIIPGGYGKITILLRNGILVSEKPFSSEQTQTRLISRFKIKKYLDSLPTSDSLVQECSN